MQTETSPQQHDAKDRLMAAALDQFTTRGYASTSVRELCAAANVTKPVLYYYFNSKAGLYLQLLENAFELFEGTIANLTTISGTAKQRIIHFCAGVYDIAVKNIDIVRLMYSIYFGTPQGAPDVDLDKYFSILHKIISDEIGQAISSGELRPGDINDISWIVISTLNCAIEEQLSPLAPRINRQGLTRMLEIIFAGLTAGGKDAPEEC